MNKTMTFKEIHPVEDIRGLSMKQPYAELMLHGKVETRTWKTSYRGWALICSSKEAYSINDLRKIAGENNLTKILSILKESKIEPGKAIAIGFLEACLMSEESNKKSWENTFVDACNLHNTYFHYFTNVQKIKPFDIKGRLNYFTLTEEIINKIEIL
jgi:hypothetical protein